MAVDHIRYDILAQEALRGVLRTVLEDAAKNGLPGEHHFYILFDTQAEGVRLSQRMRAQYPEEMTIVLQHQFWDLIVTEQGFEVGLSFGGVPERLAVPFAAIKQFADPSVQFGLQFEQIKDGDASQESDAAKATEAKTTEAKTTAAGGAGAAGLGAGADKENAPKAARPPAEHTHAHAAPAPAVRPPANPPAAEAEEPPRPEGGAEVVRLDRFRKK
jgi:hypothetical protein